MERRIFAARSAGRIRFPKTGPQKRSPTTMSSTTEQPTSRSMLLGRELDLCAARLITMLFLPLAYSAFELAKLGIATAHSSSTYLPIAASLLSMTAIYLWVWLLRSDQNHRSLKKALAAWSYLIAYLFS